MSLARSVSLCHATLPAFAVVGIFWGAFAAQVPDIKQAIGAEDAVFGLTLLCGAVGAVSAMWLAPRIDARLARRTMPFAALAAAAAFQLPGLAPGVAVFAVAMFLAAGATGLLDVVMNARVSQIEARHDTALMNLNHATFSFTYAASAFSAGIAREAGIGPPMVFAVLGLLTVAISTRLWLGPDHHGDADAPPASGRGFGQIVIWAGLITLFAFMTENATETWSALHIERTLGGRAAEGALGPTILGLTMGIGRLAGHFVTPRGQERRVILLAALVSGSGAALAAQAPSPMLAYLGFGILGFGVSVIAPLALALAGRMARPRDRALAISRVATIGYFGFFIGPPTMGFVSEAVGLRASFGVIAVLMFSVPLLLWPLRASAPAAPGPGTAPEPAPSAPRNPRG